MNIQNNLKRVERELKIRNYSSKTIKSYLYGLRKYFAFKKQNLEYLDTNNVKAFLLVVQNKNISAQTRNLYLNAIKFFYRDIIQVNKKIKIHLGQINEKLSDLLSDVKDCKIDFNTGTNITINSDESELVLLKVLQILNSNNIVIEDLSAMPTNLEEIFLKVVDESNESNS